MVRLNLGGNIEKLLHGEPFTSGHCAVPVASRSDTPRQSTTLRVDRESLLRLPLLLRTRIALGSVGIDFTLPDPGVRPIQEAAYLGLTSVLARERLISTSIVCPSVFVLPFRTMAGRVASPGCPDGRLDGFEAVSDRPSTTRSAPVARSWSVWSYFYHTPWPRTRRTSNSRHLGARSEGIGVTCWWTRYGRSAERVWLKLFAQG